MRLVDATAHGYVDTTRYNIIDLGNPWSIPTKMVEQVPVLIIVEPTGTFLRG